MSTRKLKSGFTLLELIVAIAILAIVLIGVMSAYFTSIASRIQNRETAIVLNTARAVLEYIRNENVSTPGFSEVFEAFRPEGGLGNEFNVDENFNISNIDATFGTPILKPVEGQNFVGKIEFPIDSDDVTLLTEDPDDLAADSEEERLSLANDFGYPLDITGDEQINASIPASDLEMLPIRITFRWQSGKGIRVYKIVSILTKKS